MSSAAGIATGADVVVALLFVLAWVFPGLGSLFEMLVSTLAAELIVLLALFTLTRGHVADTHAALLVDWKLARGAVLLVALYFAASGELGWPALFFMAAVLFTAEFPLRILAHANWSHTLATDAWILLGAVLAACLVTIFVIFPALPGMQVPEQGIVHDLVVRGGVPPQQMLAFGTFYFAPKAILNSMRFCSGLMEDQLVSAFRRTRYVVADGDWQFVMTIDVPCPSLERCHQHFGVEHSAFITAWNPGSVVRPDAENNAAQDWLEGEVRRGGHPVLRGSGEDPSGRWRAEPSLLVLGIGEAGARMLGRRYRQKAIVVAGGDAVPRLLVDP